jgi:hypothetical protein
MHGLWQGSAVPLVIYVLMFWTTLVWALAIGWCGARVVWYLMSRPDYRSKA